VALTTTVCELTSSAEAWAPTVAWDDLLARSVSDVLFLTRTFQSIWWETLGEGQLRVLVGETDAATPRFIAPLCISEVAGLGRTVRLIGGSEVADYLDILAAPGDLELAWRSTLDHLHAISAAWDAIDLRALPEASPSRSIVARLAPEYGWSVAEGIDDVCPVIALPGIW
jgi:hypothetical protein